MAQSERDNTYIEYLIFKQPGKWENREIGTTSLRMRLFELYTFLYFVFSDVMKIYWATRWESTYYDATPLIDMIL